jgi:anti-anti-sigma factor
MELIHTPFPNCDLIKVSGRIDSYTSPQLMSQIDILISSGRYKIILDLRDVTYVSSAGLRVMIDAQKKCRLNSRGETVLLNLPPRVYETLELAGFLPLYELFTDKEYALEHFT